MNYEKCIINRTRAATKYYFIVDQSVFFSLLVKALIIWSIQNIMCSSHSPRGLVLMSFFVQLMNQKSANIHISEAGTTYIFVLVVMRQIFSQSKNK